MSPAWEPAAILFECGDYGTHFPDGMKPRFRIDV